MSAQPLPWFPGDAKEVEPEKEMTFAATIVTRPMRSLEDIALPAASTGLAKHMASIAGGTFADTIRTHNFTGLAKQFIGFAKTNNAFLDFATGAPLLPKGALGHILLPGRSYHMSVRGSLMLMFKSSDDVGLLNENGHVTALSGANFLPYFQLTLLAAHIDVPTQSWDLNSNSCYVDVQHISVAAVGRNCFMSAPSWGTGSARIGLVPTTAAFGAVNLAGHEIPVDLDVIISPPADQGPMAYFIVPTEVSTLIQDIFTRRGTSGMPNSRWSFNYGGSIEIVPSVGLVPVSVGTGPPLGDSIAQAAGPEVEASTVVALALESTPLSAPSRTVAGAPSLRSILLPRPYYHPR